MQKQRFVSLSDLYSNQEDKGKIPLGQCVGSLSPFPFCRKSNAASTTPFPRLQLALWYSKGHCELYFSARKGMKSAFGISQSKVRAITQ